MSEPAAGGVTSERDVLLASKLNVPRLRPDLVPRPGGDVILQAKLQGFLNVTVFGMTAQQAVEAPRFAAFAWPDSFYPHLEVPARTSLEGRFGDEVRAGLRRRGHDVVNWQDYEFDAGGLAIAMDAAPRTGTGCWRSAPTRAESAMPSADKYRCPHDRRLTMSSSDHIQARTAVTRREALRLTGAGAAAMLAGGMLAACGSSSSTTSATGGSMQNVSDQLGWLKTSQWAGSYAAINNGYYRQAGISADLISGGPDIIASSVVGAGHALVGEDDNNTTLQAIAKGEPLVMFATIYQRSPYSVFSYPSKSVRTVKDFAGKKVAIPPATRPLLDPLLQKAGVSLSSVYLVPVVNISQFTSHQVDAYFGFSTNEGVAIKQKGISFITTPISDLGLKSYGNVLITRRETLAKQRALLVRYLRATIKGWEYAIAHPTQMGHLTVTKFAAPGDNLAAETGQAVAQVALIKNGAGIMRFTYPGMQEVISAMEASKSLAKPLKAADVMTTSILDAAYGSQTSIPM